MAYTEQRRNKYQTDSIHKRKRLDYNLSWKKRNPEKAKLAQKRYYEKHKEELYAKSRVYLLAHPEKVNEYAKRNRIKVRSKILEHYGLICACCGETTKEFLCIDHIDGKGNEHRRSIGSKAGSFFYLWLVRNNFPAGFQTLCFNCNMAKHIYKVCPHKIKGRSEWYL